MKVEQESICINCLYGSQPLGYYPIVCCFSNIKEMYYDKHKCNNYKKQIMNARQSMCRKYRGKSHTEG